MVLSQNDARKKICPFGIPHQTATLNCIEIDCMAWIEVYQDKGYCGMVPANLKEAVLTIDTQV